MSRDAGAPAMRNVIRVGTRASELALRQARLVQSALEARGVAAELVTFTTAGDRRRYVALREIGAKGLFTRELEEALLDGRVDCCVHSLKDLPSNAPDGLSLAALLPREDPRDVLVVNDTIVAEGLADLPRGCRVGTSSVRRRALLLHARRDLEIVDLRGNVPTRLRKVDEGQVHAAILAAAGLHRLGVHQRIDAYLDAPEWLPAPGQGIIAVQARRDDGHINALLAPLEDRAAALAASAERALLAALDGGCQAPIGALALEERGALVLHGFVSDLSGSRLLRGSAPVDAAAPAAAGALVARELSRQGAGELLAELRAAENVPVPQPE